MAAVCKFYLRGTCKYGSRCHFLHQRDDYYQEEDIYGNHSQRDYTYNSNAYSSYNSNRNYSSNSYQSYNTNRNYNSNSYQSYNHRNYNRYHVDNRQIKTITELPFSQIMELILHELQQFEERHVWKLTVIAPLKGMGNIPSFKDFSPEEIRYQYYECHKTGSTYEFERVYKELIDNVRQSCIMFSMNSQESHEMVKKMIQQAISQNEEMATEFSTDSTTPNPFSFSSPSVPSSFANNQSLSFNNSMVNSNTFGTSVFSSQNSVDFSAFSNKTNAPLPASSMNSSVFGTNSNSPLNLQSSSKLNSFSFDLKNISSATNPTSQSVTNLNISETNSTLAENIYSKLEELPPDIREQFEARTFKFGSVPLMAPPKELCFG